MTTARKIALDLFIHEFDAIMQPRAESLTIEKKKQTFLLQRRGIPLGLFETARTSRPLSLKLQKNVETRWFQFAQVQYTYQLQESIFKILYDFLLAGNPRVISIVPPAKKKKSARDRRKFIYNLFKATRITIEVRPRYILAAFQSPRCNDVLKYRASTALYTHTISAKCSSFSIESSTFDSRMRVTRPRYACIFFPFLYINVTVHGWLLKCCFCLARLIGGRIYEGKARNGYSRTKVKETFRFFNWSKIVMCSSLCAVIRKSL